MNFDIVIGNPPYNKDIYLDFITLGHKLATKYTCMIVPAKWQTKSGNNNEKFRKSIVPHMREVVYYPDCLDIFAISEADGITYFIIGKDLCDKALVINKNNYQPLINSAETRSIRGGESLWNIGNQIVQKLYGKKYELRIIDDADRLEYTVSISKMWCGSRVSSGAWDFDKSAIKPEYVGKGGVLFNPTGDIRLLGKTEILRKRQTSESGSSLNVFTSDNKDEVDSFYSWLHTKLISFLLLIYLSSSKIIKDSTWRYITDPGHFDHIFTDQELYTKYNLTQEEINVIEAVIKERK